MLHNYIHHQDTVFIGDTHGHNLSSVKYVLRYTEDVVIIILGDCGFGFGIAQVNELPEINELLTRKRSSLVFIRGNHDNPDYFKYPKIVDFVKESAKPSPYDDAQSTHLLAGKEIDLAKYEPRIRFAKDYDVLVLPDEHQCLCVGGAVSVDRCNRTLNTGYWTDEIISPIPDDMDLSMIDVVASHACPKIFNPKGMADLSYYTERDDKLNDDLLAEDNKLMVIYHKLCDNPQPLIKWYHGHYHAHYTTTSDKFDVTGLGMYVKGFPDAVSISRI